MDATRDIAEICDPRFLAGVELFNREEFFEAHEVWESLWRDCEIHERRFYQALIQAAVSLYHWNRGNAAGAVRLYHSGRRYMEPFGPHYRGLAVSDFWDRMAAYLATALEQSPATVAPPPRIVLQWTQSV